MRLIDAKQTKREITKYLEECIDNNKIEIDVTELQIRIFGIINNQPTAYNVEKVISDLESEKILHYGCHVLETNVIKIDDAVQIVKRGGM